MWRTGSDLSPKVFGIELLEKYTLKYNVKTGELCHTCILLRIIIQQFSESQIKKNLKSQFGDPNPTIYVYCKEIQRRGIITYLIL